MKTIFFSFVLLSLSLGLQAQVTLTYANNALIIGDTYTFREIQFPDPGPAGANQIWDYSKIQFTGKNPVSNLQPPLIPKMDGVGDYNLSLLENGYDYLMNSTENRLEEIGYVNSDLKLTLKYTDPVVKMKYPFSYGGQFSDHFIGIAYYNETNTIDFFGDVTVTADAYGTLILPDRLIDGSLRVKTIKKGLQINMCGTADINIVKYSWYASGYRYPVLSLTTVENRFSGGASEIIKTAFTNTEQNQSKSGLIAMSNVSVKPADPLEQNVKPDVSVNLSPNPFIDKLTYSYFLTEQMTVSLELYDMAGKTTGWLVKNQLQPSGLHTGELYTTTYGLTSGVYFMRFTFDKQVVIHKVVKI
jgi:hypothetical protein